MTALPTWASNPEARTLLAAIRIEQPDCWHIHRYAWTSCRQPKFKGMNARKLRAMHEAALEAAMDANDRDLWCKLGNEHPDDLIERVLNEPAVPYERISLDTAPDTGNPRIAA